MYYYEVLVGSMTYHGREALTYSSHTKLKPGAIVKVSLRARSVLGIVLRTVLKPDFDIKPVTAAAPLRPLPSEQLELIKWIYKYYPAPLGTVVRQFIPPTETFPSPKPKIEDEPYQPARLDGLPVLSPAQKRALEGIRGPGTFLLHGVTGSGKSRVYLELAARTMADKKSVLVLTPEIGLTAQLTKTFRRVFGSSVYTLHSQLTAAERRNIYYSVLGRNAPSLVIGPRSALFSPLHNLGLVVLDEAHDSAYKNESAPHYQSTRLAAKLASLHNATLVLGSATPSVEDYYLAKAKDRPVIKMDELAKQNNDTSAIDIVDMRRSELFSRNQLLSDVLLTHIGRAIGKGEQALIFLNRRGTANAILCQSCGWQALCPNCDLALTYHGDTHDLRCHVCGLKAPLSPNCPVCGNDEILFKSIGTKAIVDALTKLFPMAQIRRFDTDARKTERLEQHMDGLVAGDTDIIVGTQMVSKGLDLPKLSVVGIVNADSSLLIPDYTAAEQTYQLISQVVGRVGRGHRPGSTVILQTYDPDNITLLSAVHRQWEQFYETELAERKAYRFPPFTYLLKLRVLRASSKAAEAAAVQLASSILEDHPEVTIEGPAPSFRPRERGKYSWQLLIKHTARPALLDIIGELPSGWGYDIDPSNLL